jgi:hypothetical protein
LPAPHTVVKIKGPVVLAVTVPHLKCPFVPKAIVAIAPMAVLWTLLFQVLLWRIQN